MTLNGGPLAIELVDGSAIRVILSICKNYCSGDLMGKVNRREMLGMVVASATGASLSESANGQTVSMQSTTAPRLTRSSLTIETEKVLNTITAPQFLEEMWAFKGANGVDRLSLASSRLTPDALRKRGVKMAPDIRISSRTFETAPPVDLAQPAYVDVDQGNAIVDLIKGSRPDLVEQLKVKYPVILDDLKVTPLRPKPSLVDPIFPPLKPDINPLEPETPGGTAPYDPTLMWACACGGAATVCAGGGGGSDSSSTVASAGVSVEQRATMRKTYDSLIDFVVNPKFKLLVDELYELPPTSRPTFVREVLINREELTKRGIDVPDDILIQRSSFGDGRPTLFVVKKFLPNDLGVPWENLNLTFDQPHSANSVGRGAEAWRRPLPFEVQSALQSLDLTATEVQKLKK